MWDNKVEIGKNDGIVINLITLLREICREMKRRALIILVLAVLASAVSYFASGLFYTPVYTATALVALDRTSGLNYKSGEEKNNITYRLGEIFPDIFASDAVRSLVMDEMGYTDSADFDAQISSAVMAKDSNAVRLTVTSGDPQFAYDVLQSVLSNYHYISDPTIGTVKYDIISESGVPTSASNVNPGKKLAAASILLVLAGAAIWFAVVSITSDTVRTARELADVLDAKVLGTMPRVKKARAGAKADSLRIDEGSASSEMVDAMRTICFRLTEAAQEYNFKTIMLTSALRFEGKTTAAVNLAIGLTDRNSRVLLVDGNLRNPSVLAALGMPQTKKGIADVLAGRCRPEEVMVPYAENSKLTVIPGVPGYHVTGADAAALWSCPAAEQFFRNLSVQYDYILIDAAASASIADSGMIARLADGFVYVVQENHADSDTLRRGADAVCKNGCAMIGSVLNNI